MLTTIREVDCRDALAFCRALAEGDLDGIATLISHGDPGRMLVVVASILQGLTLRTFGDDPAAVLRFYESALITDEWSAS